MSHKKKGQLTISGMVETPEEDDEAIFLEKRKDCREKSDTQRIDERVVHHHHHWH